MNNEKEDKVLARVFEKYLYNSELQKMLPADIKPEDSARVAQQLIDNWVKDNAILVQAELNLTSEQKDFNEQLEEYRNSLIIYAYESELLRQKLDTFVGDEEIENYYNSNIDNFQLKGYIVKVKYIKLPSNVPDIDMVESLIESTEEEDFRLLYEYCVQHAANYFLEDDVWLYLSDILKELPTQIEDNDSFVKNDDLWTKEEEGFKYFLKIIDYKLKDDISPLSLEKNLIKDLIINKRKVELISEMRKNLLEEAMNSNEVEKY